MRLLAFLMLACTLPACAALTVTLSATPQSVGAVGQKIGLTALAAVAVAPRYQFMVADEGGIPVYVREWSQGRSTVWAPTTAGTYTLTVWVMDGPLGTTIEASASYVVRAKLSAVSVVANVPAVTAVNTRVTFTATPTDGGTVEYRPLIGYRQGTSGAITWDQTRPWGAGRATTFTPDKLGQYFLRVYARERGSTAYFDVSSTDLAIQTRAGVTGFAASINPANGAEAGALTLLSATNPVGGGTLEWKFWAKRHTAQSWTPLCGFSAASTCEWTPDAAGVWDLMVYAREAGKAYVGYDCSKTLVCSVSARAPTVALDTRTATIGPNGGAVTGGLAGAVRVDVPAGAVSGSATLLTLDTLDRAPVPPRNRQLQSLGAPAALTMSGDALPPNTALGVRVPIPADARAALNAGAIPMVGCEQDGQWYVSPATVANDEIAGTVALSGPSTSCRIGGFLLPRAPYLGSTPLVGLYKYSAADRSWKLQSGAPAGTRVAVLVHDVMLADRVNGRDGLTDLAAFLSADSIADGLLLARYDAVYAVEYPLGYGIADLGQALAARLSTSQVQLDVFAHGMGGLVARAAIERNSMAGKVRNLATLGTPHAGVPATLFCNLLANGATALPLSPVRSWTPELDDMAPGSSFLAELNAASGTSCHYYQVVGTDPALPAPLFTTALPLSRCLPGAHDGLAATASAGRDLAGEAITTAPVSFPVNHDAVARDPGVFRQITRWFGRVPMSSVPRPMPANIPCATKREPKTGLTMIYIPAGKFIMGTPTCDDPKNLLGFNRHLESEHPQRVVYLDGYWIMRDVVTVARFRAFCTATKREMPNTLFGDMVWTEAWDDRPITLIDFRDAQAYADWAGLTLPTEAQYEKAARGTDGRLYPWGNQFDKSKLANEANYSTRPDLLRFRCSPVGSFPAGNSPYGCRDMVGNVQEWCADYWMYTWNPDWCSEWRVDWFGPPYEVNPTGPPEPILIGDWRSVRGTHFGIDVDTYWWLAHCSTRGGGLGRYGGWGGDTDTGFRCVSLPTRK